MKIQFLVKSIAVILLLLLLAINSYGQNTHHVVVAVNQSGGCPVLGVDATETSFYIYYDRDLERLTLNSPQVATSYHLVDLQGRVVRQGPVLRKLTVVQTTHLQPGIYIVWLHFGGESRSAKIRVK